MNNLNHRKRFFSNFYHVAMFDQDFNIEWCDDNKLFHRIAVAHKRIEKKLITVNNGDTIVHFFLYQGRYQRALFNKFSNGYCLCRISKEIIQEELKVEDLFEYLDEISHSSLNIFNMTEILEDYADKTSYNLDVFHVGYKAQKKESLAIYNRCQNILRAFNDENNCDLIPFQKYLLRTLDIVQHATKKIPKTISLYSDPVFPATKIDYSKFELALYNLIKIALIYSTGPENIMMYVRRETLKEISVEMSFNLNTEFKLGNCKLEMHVIKYIFRRLKGHFEFYEENNTLFLRGVFLADFSFTDEEITPGRDLEFIGNWDLFEQKEINPKYMKIYNRIPANSGLLASNVTDFSDIDDDVRFAEMFFKDLELL